MAPAPPPAPPVDLPHASLDARMEFVRTHTTLAPAPLVPEIVLHTATEVTTLWHATLAFLGAYGIDAPFWSVPWAGGQALARFVLDHPDAVAGRRVLDFGAGSGLVGLACLRAGAASARAVDIDPLSEAACALNARENGLALEAACLDVVGAPASALDADVLVAGDVWYDRHAAARFGPWLAEIARSGVRVLTGDPGRAYVPDDARVLELARMRVPTTLDLESVDARDARVLELRG